MRNSKEAKTLINLFSVALVLTALFADRRPPVDAIAPAVLAILAPAEQPFDYCRPASPAAENLLVPETLFPSDPAAIKSLLIAPGDIVEISPPSPDKFSVVLVPVGYSDPAEIKSRLGRLSRRLVKIYHDVNVSFAYLNTSIPVGVVAADKHRSVPDFQDSINTMRKIQAAYPSVDRLFFILNTTDYLGVGGSFPAAAGENPQADALAAHELGHSLDLDDGYQDYYGPTLATTELITSTDVITGALARAYLSLAPPPPLVPTGGVCLGDPVFAFYAVPQDNIMISINKSAIKFNPLQIELMNNYIAWQIKTNPSQP